MGFSEYLEDKLGGDFVEANGHKVFHCPFCYKNHDYKLYVNTTSGKREGLWDCKRCGRVGNPIGFVMEYEKVDFLQARSILDSYGVTMDSTYTTAIEEGLTEEEALYLMLLGRGNKAVEEEVEEINKTPPPLPRGFKLLMDNLGNPEVIPFLEYIVNVRGIAPEMISRHNIGYITQGEFTTSMGKKLTIRNHIVFLTYDFDGEYMYWNTRSIERNPYLKTINASGTEEQYSRGDTLFNLNLALREEEIVLTEGVFDALTVGNTGVAGFGKQYTDKQIELILDNVNEHQRVYILLDRDAIMVKNAQGESTTVALARKLYEQHKETYIVVPDSDEDPNDLGQEKVQELIENNAVKATPEGRILVTML